MQIFGNRLGRERGLASAAALDGTKGFAAAVPELEGLGHMQLGRRASRLTRSFLTRFGYRVVEANDAVEARSVWKQCNGAVDLVLTDMVMPRSISGLDLTEELQRLKPGLKVIILSGYSAELVTRTKQIPAGVMYLAKPCSPTELANTIRRCLGAAANSTLG